jgi:glycosyltransferase involved in cell wall biosynthesis
VRILHVNDLNQVASTYASALEEHGHSVSIYRPSLAGAGAPLPLKLAAVPWRLLDLRRVIGRLNTEHFDILHVHWASYGLIGDVGRIPFVVQCHGSDVRGRMTNRVLRTALTRILRSAGAVLCITPDLLPTVRHVCPEAQFMPAPIDTEHFAPAPALGPRETTRPWSILLFARLDASKGADIAMDGVARFGRRHPEVRIRTLDWGAHRHRFRRLYGDRFEFVPRVTPDEVAELIRSADVVVGQFALGALGLSELQAMSCGKPVIASFRFPDAYLTPPPLLSAHTPSQIEARLETVMAQTEYAAAVGRDARQWVIGHHDKRVLAAQLESVYSQVTSRAR